MNAVDNYMKLRSEAAERLYNYRKKFNITQKRMAGMLGCHETYVSQIERRIRPPSPRILKAMQHIMED